MEFEHKFDGIWASASLLHVPKTGIDYVLFRLTKALKKYGILYTSFKYGTDEYEKCGRYFNCYDENSVVQLLNKLNNLELLKIWVSSDLRPFRNHEQWLNCLIKKIC